MFDANGNKTWEAQLDIYGRVRTFAGSSLNECPWRYQGQYFDADISLYYNRFRWYDQSVGSYISQDPIGILGDRTDFYAYVKDPNRWLDVLGLQGVFSEELASTARDVHNLAGSQIAINQSIVAIARVNVDGDSVLFASGNNAVLNPAQRQRLRDLGVKDENIFSGARYRIPGDDLANHAERVIQRNLPLGAEIDEWGISWASKQRNEMCPNCQQHFGHSH